MAQTLTDFLLARIAEDEQRVAGLSSGSGDPDFFWGPDRIRAECEAKRGLLGLHWFLPFTVHVQANEAGEQSPIAPDSFEGIVAPQGRCKTCSELEFPCNTLRAVAAPYGDHPDYRAEWRP